MILEHTDKKHDFIIINYTKPEIYFNKDFEPIKDSASP